MTSTRRAPSTSGSASLGSSTARRSRRKTPTELIEQHSAGESAGFLLWHANLRWQRTVAEVLAPFGLTHVQFVVLTTVWWLGRDGRPPRQREVAEHGGLDPAMTSQVVRALVAKGWVVRRPDPIDARASLLHVTTPGRDLAERAVVTLDEADRTFFQIAGNRAELIAILRGLADRDERGSRP